MTNRKLQALRNLAERPGTEAEGKVAREKLKQAEEQASKEVPRQPWDDSVIDQALRRAHRASGGGYRTYMSAEDMRARMEEIERIARNARMEQKEREARNARFFSDLFAKVGKEEIDAAFAEIEALKAKRRSGK